MTVLSRAAAFLVALGVALEFAEGWLAEGWRETVDNARVTEIARLGHDTEVLRNENLALQKQLAPRTPTPEQFEILRSLKGKVRAVTLVHDADPEAARFAALLLVGLEQADIKVNLFRMSSSLRFTGVKLWDKFAFHKPDGYSKDGEILAAALESAGLMDEGSVSKLPANSGSPDDVPMILVGEKPWPVAAPKPPADPTK
jgi:hypothetical protein